MKNAVLGRVGRVAGLFAEAVTQGEFPTMEEFPAETKEDAEEDTVDAEDGENTESEGDEATGNNEGKPKSSR